MKLENKYDKTGNYVPIEYNELVSLVFQAMDNYIDSIINNSSVINPLEKHVIIVKKNGQVLQVPDDIQQEAITMYFEKNPQTKKFFNINNYDNDNDNDNYDNGNGNDNNNSPNKLYFVFIICIIAIFIYFFGKHMKYL